MPHWEKYLVSSLRTKMLIPTVLVLVALLALMSFVVNEVFQHQFQVSAHERLRDAEAGFKMAQVMHRMELERRFKSLAREPRYYSILRNYQELNALTVRDQLERMYADENLGNDGVVLVFFTPTHESIADKNIETMVQKVNVRATPKQLQMSCATAAKQALQGETGFDTVRVKDQILSIVSIPIMNANRSGAGEVIGALTFGKLMDQATAHASFQATGLHGYVAFIAGEQVSKASTLTDTNMTEAKLVGLFKQLENQPNSLAGLENVILDKNHYYCTSGVFPSLNKDTSLGYLLFTKYQDQLDALADIRSQLVLVSLLAILGGVVLLVFFLKRAFKPLAELQVGAEAVGRGDFSRRVTVRSRDECGQLAHAFNRMTADVERSQSQLKQTVETLQTTQAQLIQSEKLSAVGEFVAGIAHELNNPLAAVMGFAEILKTAPVDPKYQRHLLLIYKSAERCQKIVHSLLSFARRQQPQRSLVDVNNLVEEVLEIVAYQLKTNNIKVLGEYYPALPPVLADSHQIQQIIINLINNARQAIESYQNLGKLVITTEVKQNKVRIKIADNGPGISPENLSKIFDPFFTTKGVGKGTGLGLSLCYGLIKDHGGNILVESQLGSGATFIVELPAALNVPAKIQAPADILAKNDNQEGSGKTILVVDDEELLLLLAKEELCLRGYTVITANSGEAALREVAERKIDAILCDIKMPGLNGRQVLERVRKIKPALAQHFAFVTGDVINESLAEYFDKEKVQWLNKPFGLVELRGIAKSISN